MAKGWTKEQLDALEARGGDLLLSAAAGSGKTAVLVERIIRRVLEDDPPVDIDRLLVVTFTHAAATEMSQRIGAAINEKMQQYPQNLRLQEQLTCLAHADIKTIHAFCLQVIRSYYYLLDMDPAARTADPSEIALLQQEVMDDLFETLYEEQDKNFFRLLEIYGKKLKDDALKEQIQKIYNFSMGYPFPERLLEKMAQMYSMNEEESMEKMPWMSLIHHAIRQDTEAMIAQTNQALELAKWYQITPYEETLEQDLQYLKQFAQQTDADYASMRLAYTAVSFVKLKRYAGPEKDRAEQVKELREQVKKTHKEMGKRYFAFGAEMQEEVLRNLYPVAKALSDITIRFMHAFSQAKREKQIIDFHDYEHFCLKVLVDPASEYPHVIPTEAAKAISEKYEEIFIDEYQDSNMVQEMILSAVSRESRRENNRFMVGDVKQSIYRFRLAMPEIFMDKYYAYSKDVGAKQRKLVLSKNFRSHPEVLSAVNFIFRQIMSPSFGDVPYDKDAMLYPGLKLPECTAPHGGSTEVHLIDEKMDQETKEMLEDTLSEEIREQKQRHIELKLIIRRIRELMAEGYQVYDKHTGTYRPLQFGDVAIIMRSVRLWAGVLEEVCGAEGIPYYAEVGGGYFDTPEVDTVLNMLRLIDNPRQDIPLISLLHSPVFSLTTDDLAQIRLAQKEGCFYDCVVQYCETAPEGELRDKLNHFLTELTLWRDQAIFMTVSQLVAYLYDRTGYYDYAAVGPGGGLRRANLELLLEKAEQYEEGSRKGLFFFIRYMEDRKESADDQTASASIAEGENLVHILTIHKSKGLEFPVVFLADLGKSFNQKNMQAPVILHADYGYGLEYVDVEHHWKCATLSRTAIAEAIHTEDLSEEVRVLYVAMTRARDKLILVGSQKNLQKKLQTWAMAASSKAELLPTYYLRQASCPLDWIMAAVLRDTACRAVVQTQTETMMGNIPSLPFSGAAFQLYLYQKQDLLLAEGKQTAQEQKEPAERENPVSQDASLAQTVKDNLNWVYPYQHATVLPAKLSISEIKRRTYQESVEETAAEPVQMPMFVLPDETETIGGTRRGTAVHTFLQHLDFTLAYSSQQELRAFAKTLEQDGILSKEESKLLPYQKILHFCTSDLVKRMQVAENIEKEKQFSILLEGKDIFSVKNEEEVEEKILVNGVIDCYFQEADGTLVLVDYKTDHLYQEEAFRKRYEIQLRLYRLALERISGKKVKESLIYSFAMERCIKF